ncbi:MAG TPA: HupE/UreJ family protein [Polyangiaceae bacterium]|nr:HupE/UreJ family protein [Polyangiaceae bacterium]
MEFRARGPRLSGMFLALCVCSAALSFARSASAHAIGLSRGTYRATERGLSAEIVLARAELDAELPALDGDRDGLVAPSELALAHAELELWFTRRLRVTSGNLACDGKLESASLTEQDGIDVELRYRCAEKSAPVTAALGFLTQLSHGHRHAAQVVEGSSTREEICFRGRDLLTISRLAAEASAPASVSSRFEFLRMGFEHILSGYDHVVFLLGLILTARGVRSLLGVVTAFTLGHSLSLALVTLNVLSAPPALIEPAIALSIAYVGLENLLRLRDREQGIDRRWLLTFPFGLVHGFGFAGALQAVSIPRAELPRALLAFNSGVELGQVLVLFAVLPLVLRLRRRSWFALRAAPALSALIIAAGMVWFVARIHTGAPDALQASPGRSSARGS